LGGRKIFLLPAVFLQKCPLAENIITQDNLQNQVERLEKSNEKYTFNLVVLHKNEN